MQSKGMFVYKSLTYRGAGVFQNDEGKEVNYPAAYILKVDEITEDGEINQRKFKVPEKATKLINDLKSFEPYEKIVLVFKITLYDTRCSIEVVDVEPYVDVEDI